MIDLSAKRTNIVSIAGIWRKELHDYLFKMRTDKCKAMEGHTVISSHDTYFKKMKGVVDFKFSKAEINKAEKKWIKTELDYFKRNFNSIILAGETAMIAEKNNYNARCVGATDNAKGCYKDLMVGLYGSFTQQEDVNGVARSHRFFRKLKITTCPYCNRQYAVTLDCDNGKTAPEYDHFYYKSDYPVLAVSFYNLVPSCHTCNHIKGIKKTVTINPYFSGFESRFVFVDDNDDSKLLTPAEVMKRGGGKILLRRPDGTESATDKGNIETFALNEIYALHDQYVSDIVVKVQQYEGISKDLVSTFQTKAKTPQEVYDFVWGRHLVDAEYEDRPLSKLTKELLEQLGVLP